MRDGRLGDFVRRDVGSIARGCARTVVLSAFALTLTPLMATSLSDSGRPAFVEEAKAALLAESLLEEARAVWESRPASPMAERGGRVYAPRVAPDATEALRSFAAGRVGERAPLLTPGLANGDAEMRTALAGPQNFASNMTIAASLRSNDPKLGVSESVQTASLRPTDRPGSSADDSTGSEMAFAPSSGPSASSRFNDILRRDEGFVPPLGEKDHAWAATPLPAAAFSKEEQTCLATGIYFEARGEVARGQEAVAQVILNRVRAPSYPDTICGVVYQNQHMRNRCQFSFACDGIPDRITNRRAYEKAERIALEVTKGEIWLPEVGSATHYHATYVRPRWARAMERVDKIGLHIFYRTFGGGWN